MAQFGSAAYTAGEAAGSRAVSVRVDLSPAPDSAVSVSYTVGGTATSAVDFAALGGTVSVGTSGTAAIAVAVADDNVDEADETVILSLVDGAGYDLGARSQATVTIADDDPLPTATLHLASASVSESGAAVAVTARLNHPSDQAVTLAVASSGAGAVLSADKTLTIAAGDTTSTGTVTLDPADDMVDNADRTVTVTADASGGRGVADPVAVELTVTDDEAAPVATLVLGAASVSESGSAVAVTATLDRASDVDVVLAVSAAGSGFTLSGSALTIAAGQTASTGEVSITPVDDGVDNADRDVTVTAAVTSGRGVAAPAPVVLVITDDDGTPSVSLSVASPSVAESGSPVAVTAALSRASDADVVLTVALQGTGAALSANKALTITAGQTTSSGTAVTVIPADDDTDNADRTVTVSATASGGGVAAPAPVELEITDEDPTVVTLSRSGGTGPIDENAGTAELTVTLGRALIAGETVEVPLAISGTGIAAADFSLALKTGVGVNTGVTLAAGGLLAPKLTLADAVARTAVLVLTAVQDDADEGASETATVTLGDLSAAALSTNVGGGAEPSDDGDENTTDNTVEVVITDDDTAALVVAGAPVEVGENSGTSQIAVRLASRPTHAVTVAVSASSAAATVSPAALTFQPDGWDRPQPVTVTGADDDVDNAGNKRDTTVILNPASSDALYGALADVTVSVSVIDDDGAGVSVSKTAVTVHENGGADTYEVVLGAEPTHAVTVTVASGDTGAATVAPGSLVFQTGDWDEPRTVTVTGTDDNADNPGDKRDVVVTHAVSSSDAAYHATPAAPVSVAVVDDDGAGVNVSKADVSVTEGGASDTYEIVLGSQPTHAVTVTVAVPAGAGATVNKSSGVAGTVQTLEFTVAEWSTAQTVTVAAVDDSADQGAGRSTRITHTAASTDPRYDQAPAAPVNVAIADDDPLPVATLHLAAQSVSESGSPVAVTARLDRPSDRAVTLTVASAGAGAVLSADKALTIAAGETTSTGTVTLDPADDVVDNADRTVTVTADASGGRGVADPVAVELTVADDEAAPVATLVLGSSSVSESGSAVSVTATLDRASDVDVVLTVAAVGSGFTLSGSALTIAAGQTASTGEVSITPVNDNVDNADRQATVTATVTAGRGVAAPAPVVLAITDDDGAPSVSLSVASPSVAESGSPVAVTATLSRASDADVVLTVALQGAGAVLSANKTLTITAGQTASSGAAVTVIPADDDTDNADRQVTVSATVTAGRGVAAPAARTLKITDDDPTVVTLSRSGGTGPIDENAGTAELTVTLGRALATGETVEVPLTVSGVSADDFSLALKTGVGVNTGVTLAAGGLLAPKLTLANAAARTAVLVLTAVQDQADEGASETATVTLGDLSAGTLSTNVGGGAEPSDDGDDNTPDNTVAITITDDDTAALVVAGAPVEVSENSGTAQIAVRLTSRPTAAVTVAVSVSSAAATASPAALTFQPDAWDRPQPVTVTGADDDLDNPGNKRDTTLVLNPASSDPAYNALADTTVAVSVIDDDGAGVSVSKTAVTVHEDGGTDTYTVVLGAEPTHAVTVAVASGDTGVATVAPGSLTFQTGDWDEPRTVTVTGTDDNADNPGDKRDVVVAHAVSSSDAAYQATPAAPVSVTVVDDDGAGVNVSKAAVSVAEGGASDIYEVVLGSQPTHAVTVTVAVPAGAGATVNKNSGVAGSVQTLEFTVAEWNTAQTVTVAAVDDSTDQGTGRTARIAHTAASTDPRYSAAPVAPVTVAIADDDPLPVATLRLGSASVSESGSPVAVTARLDRPSDRAVTLAVASSGAGAALSAGKTLTIAAGDTTSSGTVTLDPADDAVDNADRTVTVTAVASGGRGVADPVAVELTVADDEAAPVVTLVLGAASVAESGSAVLVTATLSRASDVDVVLAVAAAGSGFTLSGSALTVAAGQTASTGEVSITPVNDNVDNADRDVTVTATVTAGRGVAAPAAVVLVITDDDGTPSVSLSVASSVAESGSPVAVTATLSRASDADVVLTVALQGTGAALSANKALTITAGQTASSGAAVTVIPADDDTDNADRQVTVSAAVTSGRGVAAPAPVVLEITDDDPTLVTLSRSAGTGPIDENAGTAELTVTLGRALAAGETVEVPLAISGVGTADFSLALKTGVGVNTGVTLAAGGLLAPRVTLADAAARTAVLVLTAVQDDADEGASETATVTLGDLSAGTLSTNVGGGAEPSDDGDENTTDNTVEVVITDDDTAALVVAGAPVEVSENSGTAQIAVRLGSRPTHAVTVAVSASSAAATVSPAALTFQPDAWDRPQPVMVTGADDDADNPGNKRDTTVVLNPASSDPAYSALADTAVAVSVIDDDGAGVSVSKTAVTVHEDGGADTYTVVLGAEPTHAVTVTVASGDTGAATVAPGSLVFQPSAWDQPRTVTVTGVDDDADNPGDRRTVTVTHTAASSDSAYSATPVAPLTVTVVDDDGAGVNVSEAAVSVAEGGTTDTYEVVLGSQPTHDVAVTVTAGAGATVNRSGGTAGSSQTLTFTSGDYGTAQTVTVAAIDDNVDQGAGRATRISHTAASADPRYSAVPVAPVTVAIADDDPLPTATLHLASASVSESGSAVAVTARLDRPSDRVVTLAVASSGAGAVLSSGKTLTIAAGQTTSSGAVTLDPADDGVDNADRTVTVTAVASGGRGVADPAAVELTVSDDDATVVSISGGGRLREGDAGVTADVTVSLGRALVAGETVDVPITLSSSTGAVLRTSFRSVAWRAVSGATLHRDPVSRSRGVSVAYAVVRFSGAGAQSAVIRFNAAVVTSEGVAVDTDGDDEDETVSVSLAVTANSASRGNLPGGGLAADPGARAAVLTVSDSSNKPALVVSETAVAVGENGGIAGFTVALGLEPTAAVTVAVTSSGTAATVTPAALTFQTDAWDVPQTVTVTGVDDDADNTGNKRDATVTLNPSSDDTGYNALADTTVAVSVIDDDGAGVSVSKTAVTVHEDGGADTYTVVLGSEPTHAVTVTVTSGDTGAATVAPGSLVFQPSAWDEPQTVTVTGTDDNADNPGDKRDVVVTHSVSSSDAAYHATPVAPVSVAVVDDDGAGVNVSKAAVSVAEGGATDTYTVVLGSQPTHAVTVTVAVPAGAGATVNKSSGIAGTVQTLEFTRLAWSTAQTVTVAAVDDSTDQGTGRSTRIAHTAASTDPRYNQAPVAPVSVAIADDDPLPVATLRLGAASVSESGSAVAVTARLDRPSDRAVTLTVASAGAGAVLSAGKTLTIAAGDTTSSGTVTLDPADDGIDNADRTVTVTAVASGGRGVADPAAVQLTVADDEAAPVVTLVLGAASVSESGSAVLVTATLSRASDVDVVLAVAAAGSGFTLSGSALTVAAGQTSSTGEVSITPVDDDVDNADRQATVTATVTAGRGVAAPAPVVLAITDDDGTPSVSLSVASPSVAESGSPVAVTATLSRASDEDVVLTVALQGTGAALSANKALTITAGQTASSGAAVTVIPADDDVDNADRQVTVSAAVTSGRGVAAPAARTLKITDDDPTVVTLSRSAGTGPIGENAGTAELTVALGRALAAGETVEVPLAISGVGTADFSLALKTGVGVNTGVTLAAGGLLAPRVTLADAAARTAVLVLTAVQDDADEGASETATITLGDLSAGTLSTNVGGGAEPSDDGDENTTDNTVEVVITDDDTAALVVAGAPVEVSENSGTAQIAVRLGSRPTHAVTVAVSASSAAATVSPAALTFQPDAWDRPQPVMVTGADDDADNPGNKRDTTVVLNPASSDPAYSALADTAVAVSVIDDDGAGVSVSKTAVTVHEDGGADTYTVVLGAEPTHAVTVTVASGDTGAATVAPGSLVFQPSAWDQPRTVTVTGVDDDADNPGDRRTVTVTHTAASSDSAYSATPVAPLTVTVVDDDGAGVNVSEAAVSVAEGGTTDTYEVVLGSQPTHDVAVTVTAGAGATVNRSGGTAGSSQTLTFTSGDYGTAQTVTVAAIDDNVDQGAGRATRISHTAASADPRYSAVPVAPVTVAIADDDPLPTATLHLASASVSESGSAVAVTARLDRPSDRVVTLAVASSGAGAVLSSGKTLTIAAGQTTSSGAVTLDPADDGVDNADRTVTVTAVASGGRGVADPAAVELTVSDDDATVVSISGGGRLREGDAGVTADVTVSLGRALVAGETVDVPITLSSSTGAVLRTSFRSVAWRAVSGATLHRDPVSRSRGVSVAYAVVRFSGAGAQSAVIRFNAAVVTSEGVAVDTDGDDEDETVSVSLAVTANSASRGNLPGGGLAADPGARAAVLTVSDSSNKPALVVSETAVAVGENGGIAGFTVALGLEPTAAVTVAVTSSGTAATVTPAALTFQTDAWDVPQTVTVTGVDDDADNTGNKRDATVTLNPSSDDTGYNALADTTVAVSVIDDDGAGVSVSKTAVTVHEDGGADTYTVVLGSEPTHAVTVTVTSGDTGAATVAPGSLVFQPSAWDEPQDGHRHRHRRQRRQPRRQARCRRDPFRVVVGRRLPRDARGAGVGRGGGRRRGRGERVQGRRVGGRGRCHRHLHSRARLAADACRHSHRGRARGGGGDGQQEQRHRRHRADP